MKKQLFSVMLCLGAMGGLSTFPMPLQAAVSQSQTIKVKGQIVDDQGEPLTGATIKIKGGQGVIRTVRLPCADARSLIRFR